MFKSYETELAGRKLVIETGKLAGLANGNVVVKYGDTVVMVNVTASKEPKEGIDFFPLSVDFEEKMYSVGKIPGSYTKREGKPSDKAILVSRAIDRPLRPLFPKDFRNDVVVVATVLCVEQDNSPEVAAMIGASAALSISDIPFGGPTAAVNVGLVNGEIVINPTEAQRKVSDLNLTVAGTAEKVAMIEAGANEVPDDVMLEAIKKGHEEIKKVCQFIQKIKDEIGKPKFAYKSFAVDHDLYEELEKDYTEKMKIAVQEIDKDTRDNNVAALTEEIENALAEKLGEEIKKANGEDTTYLTVLASSGSFMVFSEGGIGTVLKDDMKLPQPANMPEQDSITLPTVTMEGLSEIDADHIIVIATESDKADLEASSVWSQIRAVKDGNVTILDASPYFSQAYNPIGRELILESVKDAVIK